MATGQEAKMENPASAGLAADAPGAGAGASASAPAWSALSALGLGPAQRALVVILGIEALVFSFIGTHFFTVANAFEILRLSVEIGLLSVALTPVIISGGIDLSVGSLMGLAAIVFGALWRDAHWPIGLAALAALALGALAGALNGLLITRGRAPALIVTLGTYSLFRGLAEGLTGGVDNYTNFPSSFLFLGQGYLPGGVPAQVPIFVVAAWAFWVLQHRSTFGRGMMAIGFSPEGARHAGLPVDRLLLQVYTLAGLVSSLAAIIYVAHLGQAKADAGTGYELAAITAVVLGGTSIFGGRGSVPGTLLGLLAIVVLRNGLLLADQPGELAGVLTGALLLAAIAIGGPERGGATPWRRGRKRDRTGAEAIETAPAREELKVKNSQVAWICAAVLLGALINVMGNFLLVRWLDRGAADGPPLSLSPPRPPTSTPRGAGAGAGAGAADDRPASSKASAPRLNARGAPITIAMMPKSKGNSYFIACRKGAEEAANELGVKLIWDGPTDPDPSRQNEIVDTWITRGVDVIAVAVENRQGISSVLRKARARGVHVVTWDADAEPDARAFFVNQATPEGIGRALMDNTARILDGRGEFAIITASLTAANMIEWQKCIEERRAEKYPDIRMAALRPCDDLQKKAFDEANAIMTANPKVKVIVAICTPALPGSAEAVKQAGRSDVKVIGLGLPNDNRQYVHSGIIDCIVLWNSMDLGYLAVHAACSVVDGSLAPGARSFRAGRLGAISLKGDNVLLGQPFLFTRKNIDQFDF